jgi:Ca2+/Na+ antiporter
VLNSSLEEMVKPFDKVRIGEDSFPVGNIFGLNIYEALHIPTKKKIYITSEELLK